MYEISVWVASSLMMLGTIWYCYQIVRGRVNPPPASFVIFSLTFPLVFYMYMQKPGWSYTANIGLTTAILSVWMVAIVLITKLSIQKKLKVEFNPFQWIMIFAAVIVLVFWSLTKDQFTAYVLLQISSLIGYIPVYKKLWGSKENRDSFVLWGAIFLSSCVASYAAYERNDLQSWIYIIRAVPSTMVVILLMVRIELKNKALRSLQ
jgi:hypothetical protein